MSWILLTNDDGVDAPGLVATARALDALGEVRIAVPERERSWVAKAISRYGTLRVERVERDGLEIWTCSGYPADTVQIAIHDLFETPPELVVSGINVGYNHGAGFLMSSGTVGAAVEAWTSGIPAVAVSTGTVDDPWPEWRAYVHSEDARAGWRRLAGLVTGLVADVAEEGLVRLADVVSINLPFDAAETTPRRITDVARVGYERLFRPGAGHTFVHDFSGRLVPFDDLAGTDVEATRAGCISITPLRLPQAAAIPDELRRRIER